MDLSKWFKPRMGQGGGQAAETPAVTDPVADSTPVSVNSDVERQLEAAMSTLVTMSVREQASELASGKCITAENVESALAVMVAVDGGGSAKVEDGKVFEGAATAAFKSFIGTLPSAASIETQLVTGLPEGAAVLPTTAGAGVQLEAQKASAERYRNKAIKSESETK